MRYSPAHLALIVAATMGEFARARPTFPDLANSVGGERLLLRMPSYLRATHPAEL